MYWTSCFSEFYFVFLLSSRDKICSFAERSAGTAPTRHLVSQYFNIYIKNEFKGIINKNWNCSKSVPLVLISHPLKNIPLDIDDRADGL